LLDALRHYLGLGQPSARPLHVQDKTNAELSVSLMAFELALRAIEDMTRQGNVIAVNVP
jgi:hypothetical protein